MASIWIFEDLSGGLVHQDDLAEHVLGDGDILTMYGCRYECGMDYGDGSGCTMTRIALGDHLHHHALDDIDRAELLQVAEACKVMTAGQYMACNPDCTGLVDPAGDLLDDQVWVNIYANNTYCCAGCFGALPLID